MTVSKRIRYDSAVPFSALLSGLAEMILAERKARSLSVRAAAQECGIPYNCLSRAERNVGLPSMPVFVAIVTWLGIPGWDVCAGALEAAACEADGVYSTDEIHDHLRKARNEAAAERELVATNPLGVLEKAATLMRQRATGAYPGPWTSDENGDCWRLHSAPDRRYPTAQILKAPKHSTPYAEYWPDKPTGEHIVSWHPGVALAVAGWLESWAGIEWDPERYRSGDQEAAWRVAHAYLGYEMRTPLAAPEAVYSDCECRVGECECRGEAGDEEG